MTAKYGGSKPGRARWQVEWYSDHSVKSRISQKKYHNYVTCYTYKLGITPRRGVPSKPLKIPKTIAERLRECGTIKKRAYCENGCHEKEIVLYCGIRICRNPGCVADRDRRTIFKYYSYVAGMSNPWFITLSYANHHPLSFGPKNQLDKAFSSLVAYYRAQKAPGGASLLAGYIKVLELVPKEDSFYWHLHVIMDLRDGLTKSKLSELWQKFTKTSMVVDCQRIYDRSMAVAYVTKYCTKAINLPLSHEQYLKIRKMRFLSSHGCVAKFKTIPLSCPLCGGKYRWIF